MDLTQILLTALSVVLTGLLSLTYRIFVRLAKEGPTIAAALGQLSDTNITLGHTLDKMVLLLSETRADHDTAHAAIITALTASEKSQGELAKDVAVIKARGG